jgi:hypothetical protein
MQLLAGQRQIMPVGQLPHDVAQHLNCHPAVVYLRREEALNISVKHREIQEYEIQFLPVLIEHGMYVWNKKRPKTVTAFYPEPLENKLFLAAMKVADSGSEVWVSTLYRTNPGYMNQVVRAHGILRPMTKLH